MAKTFEELSVKFTADIADLTKKLDTIEGKLVKTGAAVERQSAKMGNAFSSFSRMLSVGVIIAGAKAFGDYQTKLDKLGSELTDMSGRANVGIEALQRLRFAADQNGASSDGMNIALIKLNKAMGEARGGSAEMQRAFKALGLDALVKSGASTDVVLSGIADAFKQIQDPALKAAIASKLMGKSADELVPLLSGGAQGMRDMTEAMPKAAIIMPELAKKLDNMADATDRFNLKTQGLAAWLEGGFVDAFAATMDVVGQAIKGYDDFVGLSSGGQVRGNPVANNGAARHKISYTPKPAKPIDPKRVRDFFNPSADSGGGTSKKFDEEAAAAKRYQNVVDDLNFQIAQLGRSEEAAAFQEALRNNLQSAGVDMTTREGEGIAALVQMIDQQTKAKAALAEADRLAHEEAQKWIDMRQEAGDSVASAFERAIVEGESLREVFSGLLKDLAHMIFQKMVFDQISNAVGGGGGLLASIIGAKAMGGGVNPGNAYRVGEAGPEVFVPKVPGTIVPNRSISSGGGGLTYAPVINSNGSDIGEIRRMLAKDKQDIIKILPSIMVDKQRRNQLGGAF